MFSLFCCAAKVLELMEEGAEVTILDTFSNSSPVALQRITELAGRVRDVRCVL